MSRDHIVGSDVVSEHRQRSRVRWRTKNIQVNLRMHLTSLQFDVGEASADQYHMAYTGLECGTHRGHVFFKSWTVTRL